MNKTEINKLLVEERKKMRVKQSQSLFMKRSLSIYKGQKIRAEEKGLELPFTIEQFRGWLEPFVGTACECGDKITIARLSVDHSTPIARGGSFDISNLSAICNRCNFRKGALTATEFEAFKKFVNTLPAEAREDVWRRLVLGGKWSFGK